MLMENERKKIVEFSLEMIRSGLTKGTAGNISFFDREKNLIAITPTGIKYEEMKIEDIVIINLDKEIIEGDKKPSSECDLHIEIYKKKLDINSIVHTHSDYCTILSCINETLKPIHYVLADAGKSEVPVAKYQTYGTKELAVEVANTIGDSNACLMANHGMVACGNSIESAFSLAKTCEWVAEIQWKAMSVGKPNYLSEEQIEIVIEKFKGYGQNRSDKNLKNYF